MRVLFDGLVVTGSLSPFVPICLFQFEIGISSFSLFAGISSLVKYRLAYRCVRSFCLFHAVQLKPLAVADSPFSAVAFLVGLVAWLLLFCLDEDCNPGWGDCGRPLRRPVVLRLVTW